MELDFDIETNSQPIEFEFMPSNTGGTGGISENRVREIIGEETQNLQPKEDNNLNTKSKIITGAINEVAWDVGKRVQRFDAGSKVDIDFVYAARKQSGVSATNDTHIRAVSVADPNSIIQRRIDGSADIKMPATPTKESIINKGYADENLLPKQDLKDYVKFNDYATASKAGVVKYRHDRGLYVNFYGEIETIKAVEGEISAKTQEYKPIVPSMLDYAVKVAITTNTKKLTDNEKTKACDWLGAVTKEELGNINAALQAILGV